jgi:hypothetical protein
MAIDFKPGQAIRVTINKTPTTLAARKTIERLFMKDKALVRPLEARSRNFIPLPKRRGGQIWTKRPNKIHHEMVKGLAADLVVTPQALKDLASVEKFLEVAAK